MQSLVENLIASTPEDANAILLLADGKCFFGRGAGKRSDNPQDAAIGELCFNTSMTGYQEIMTDPSYKGQIITFTASHIGNTGVNDEDCESAQMHASAAILRAPITSPSNWRAQGGLDGWLEQQGKSAICGVDTRALTRLLREGGAQNAVLFYPQDASLLRDEGVIVALQQRVAAHPSLKGAELAASVTRGRVEKWRQTAWRFGAGHGEMQDAQCHIVALDFGCKNNILRLLCDAGCEVSVLPASSSFEDIMAQRPDGVFLSNGPGDPAATGEYSVPVIRQLLGQEGLPIFGICLGHQMLCLALGLKTRKMHQGHRGGNHPVLRCDDGTVEITSQNHGFVVCDAQDDAQTDSFSSDFGKVDVTHRSLFDGSVEGVKLAGRAVFSVQHHPESSPGPHDSRAEFKRFSRLAREYRKANAADAA